MGIYLNKGNDAFKTAIGKRVFVDKSMLISKINEVILYDNPFLCVTRPRRFGKTMALSMLNAYYSKGCDSRELFHGLKIESDPSFEKHLNKHNVIMIDMNGAFSKYPNSPLFISELERAVVEELRLAFPTITYDEKDRIADTIAKIKTGTGEKFVFLIDEWDVVFRESEDNIALQDEYLFFLRTLFKSSLVTEAIDLVYMTGILPIKRYSTQSTLNVFTEYNMLNPRNLKEFIGFTQEEVDSLCDKFGMDKEEMRHWYNGYHYGNLSIYNPCSVVQAITDKQYGDYWNATSSTEAVMTYMNYDNGKLKGAITKMLAGEEVKFNPNRFRNDLTKINSTDAALTVLVHLGYLAYDSENSTCRIPNYEISQEFVNAIEDLDWTELRNPIYDSDELIKETFLGNTGYINEALDKNHEEFAGPFNKNREDVLGIIVLISYYNMNKNYAIRKEETGILGRADIVYHPLKNDRPALIVELKVDNSPENAIKQIEEKKYVDSLKGFKGKVFLLGISYDSKTLKHSSKIKVIEI